MKKILHYFRNRTVLSLISLGLIAASVVAGRERPAELVEPAVRVDTRIRAGDEIDLAKLDRTENEKPATDPFARRSFEAPQAPQAPAARAKPTAPELPFKYVGKLIEDGKLSIFLSRGEESLSVKAGETIGEYRVDKVTESEVTFTYLPLKTRQTLPL
jgi:hypothetical protein